MESKRILLVDAPGYLTGVNVGLAYLVSTLKGLGYDALPLDLNNYRPQKPEEMLKAAVTAFNPGLVGFSVMTLSYKEAVKLLRSLRGYYKGPVVWGGAHITVERGKLLEKHPEIDFLVLGEGERSLPALLEHLSGGRTLDAVSGVIYRVNGVPREAPPSELVTELDALPFPDYAALGVEEIESYPLLSSRGCPYNCVFCLAASLAGRRWRARTVDSLIAELRHAQERYKFSSFNILDDCFTLNQARAEEFCDRLVTEGLTWPWECANGIRADLVSDALVAKMKKAGCFKVSLGVESMVPEVFASVKKGETLEDIRRAVGLFNKYDIAVQAFHIIGLPGDTYERTMRSYEMSKALGVKVSVWQLLLPFPGTEIYGWVERNGRRLMSYDDANSFATVSFDTQEYPAAKRREAFIRLTLKNGGFAIDKTKPMLQRGLQAVYHVLRYDIGGLPGHVLRILSRAGKFMFRGELATQTRTKWRPSPFQK